MRVFVSFTFVYCDIVSANEHLVLGITKYNFNLRGGKWKEIQNLKKLKVLKKWDFIVIGGGASGLGIALDSASRGYKTLLLEGYDFAKGTSSRSTKLVHGGVRYLAAGDVALVKEALRERGRLSKKRFTFI
ncbi:Alpha-glycerophosphate oxidase [Aggregatibacter aphrophilus]|nr:Alpha-glycerophosphate oxidase [Aggregatibacter aphrophilus]